MQRTLVLADFTTHVGQQFEANCDPKPVGIRLVSATPLTNSAGAARDPFILIFHTPPETMLVAGAYDLERSGFARAQVQIHEMLPPQDAQPGYYYQAVFN